MTNEELKHIIEQGENETVEFKQNFNVEAIISLTAFVNTVGRKLIVGISDTK